MYKTLLLLIAVATLTGCAISPQQQARNAARQQQYEVSIANETEYQCVDRMFDASLNDRRMTGFMARTPESAESSRKQWEEIDRRSKYLCKLKARNQ